MGGRIQGYRAETWIESGMELTFEANAGGNSKHHGREEARAGSASKSEEEGMGHDTLSHRGKVD